MSDFQDFGFQRLRFPNKDFDILDFLNNLADPDSRIMVYGDVDISISLQNQTDEDILVFGKVHILIY